MNTTQVRHRYFSVSTGVEQKSLHGKSKGPVYLLLLLFLKGTYLLRATSSERLKQVQFLILYEPLHSTQNNLEYLLNTSS